MRGGASWQGQGPPEPPAAPGAVVSLSPLLALDVTPPPPPPAAPPPPPPDAPGARRSGKGAGGSEPPAPAPAPAPPAAPAPAPGALEAAYWRHVRPDLTQVRGASRRRGHAAPGAAAGARAAARRGGRGSGEPKPPRPSRTRRPAPRSPDRRACPPPLIPSPAAPHKTQVDAAFLAFSASQALLMASQLSGGSGGAAARSALALLLAASAAQLAVMLAAPATYARRRVPLLCAVRAAHSAAGWLSQRALAERLAGGALAAAAAAGALHGAALQAVLAATGIGRLVLQPLGLALPFRAALPLQLADFALARSGGGPALHLVTRFLEASGGTLGAALHLAHDTLDGLFHGAAASRRGRGGRVGGGGGGGGARQGASQPAAPGATPTPAPSHPAHCPLPPSVHRAAVPGRVRRVPLLPRHDR
jgi:hypothetical protein